MKLKTWLTDDSTYLADSRKTMTQMPMADPKQGHQMQMGMKASAI